jgi:uncharacterized protein YkwD
MKFSVLLFFVLLSLGGFSQNSYSIYNDSSFKENMLAVQNKYRSELGVPGLAWNDSLAKESLKWAEHLTDINTMKHSETTAGENIASGLNVDYVTLVDISWGKEKSDFVYGAFPNCSKSNNWQHVGHYTQMIWKNTTEVGCAIAKKKEKMFLVCRYNPPGNFMGEKPY